MTSVDLKLYQVGTFAAGNRLLPLEDRSIQADPNRSNSITSGHRACQGCGEVLGARYVLDAAMRATGGSARCCTRYSRNEWAATRIVLV